MIKMCRNLQYERSQETFIVSSADHMQQWRGLEEERRGGRRT